ncbi:selenium cofactor biosynthesis protein YqeC [Natrinema halophilum]|uniref:selenium cofactor biosynthesis protein YqeC n=1 Tax=Natrinema halophilum TaxID=1699371 RepID=UPI001F2425F6|nr:selenium cofactor biosynthesis protein YqeC [Natrinema halophilum]UHQ96190.1 putative selenium-dependent hydroxylase accessory protein YqeC [Natrinema halophilum]
MNLAETLGLGDDELVSFVGAGGKKTAMTRLVAEASERGLEAGYTTTTHMPPPDLPLVLADPDRIESSVDDATAPIALARTRVSNPSRVDEKVRGYQPATLNSLFDDAPFDWLLVKADGARMREFKAPGPNEPPIPQTSTVVVPVASVQAVGQPLADDVVHRVDRIERCADISAGERITPDVIGQVLAHPDGGLKHVPDDATVVPLVNKADDATLARQATDAVSTALERTSRLDRGIVTSFETNRLTAVT